jgi:hypothetical protein
MEVHIFRLALILWLIASAAAVVVAQSMPTTSPSAPKAVYKRLALAMAEGDADTVASLLHADTPAERRICDALIAYARSTGRLRRAAIEQFGLEGSRALIDPATTTQNLDRIDGATEAIDGEQATLTLATPDTAVITLRLVDGEWKLPVSSLAADTDPEELDRRVAELLYFAQIIDQTAAELEADRYRTLEEAVHRLRERMMRPPGTQPATQEAD